MPTDAATHRHPDTLTRCTLTQKNMLFAIFSDIHDNWTGLRRTLADAERAGADRLVFLGDAGRDPGLVAELRRRDVLCTCGNWEVSGVRRFPPALADWVSQWPAVIAQGQTLFCHATPDMPPDMPPDIPDIPDLPSGAQTTIDLQQLVLGGMGWSALFPRLQHNEEAVWRALAVLEERDLRVAFHGHTHVQQVWAWSVGSGDRRRLRAFTEPAQFALEAGPPHAPVRYLIGVGSAGAPQDGLQLRYVLYDDATHAVTLRRLDNASH